MGAGGGGTPYSAGRNFKGGYTTAEDDGGLYPPWIDGQPQPGAPTTQQPPGQQPTGTGTPPGTPAGAAPGSIPGRTTIPSGNPSLSPWEVLQNGGLGIRRQAGFYGTPFWQTYGGQASPYADDGAQILSSWQLTGNGAGRFNANAAARYGFQGGTQQWRPDANPWGQPIAPYQWQPRAPLTPPQPPASGAPGGTPPGGSAPPGGAPPGGTPPGGPPSGGAVDHTANFRTLMGEDPRLAHQYIQRNGDTMDWWNKNRLGLFDNDWDKINQFTAANNPQSSNAAPLNVDEMRRLNQMAGINQPMFNRIFGPA